MWDPSPSPRGTFYTIIDVAKSKDSLQFRDSLQRLPEDVAGLPRLRTSKEEGERLMLVVSWCRGTNLEKYFQRVAANKSFTPCVWEPVRRIRSLAHLLRLLHRFCRVIHGDIKPANLILPRDSGTFSLIDFGSSWQIERTKDRALGDGVDQYYSAPEVFLDLERVDDRADQFSTAVVLFEMLTLKLPYIGYGGLVGHPLYRAIEKDYEPPSQLITNAAETPKSILAELDRIVARALKPDPKDRYPTMHAFCDALDGLWARLQAAKQSSVIGNSKTWWGRIFG